MWLSGSLWVIRPVSSDSRRRHHRNGHRSRPRRRVYAPLQRAPWTTLREHCSATSRQPSRRTARRHTRPRASLSGSGVGARRAPSYAVLAGAPNLESTVTGAPATMRGLRAVAKMIAVQSALAFVLERAAAACPLCGGKGATGIFENLFVLGIAWLAIRGLSRASARKRPPGQPPSPEPDDVTERSPSR